MCMYSNGWLFMRIYAHKEIIKLFVYDGFYENSLYNGFYVVVFYTDC